MSENDFITFLEAAKESGGSEMANCHIFIERLCGHLGISRPDMAKEENQRNDYVFERRVDKKHGDGSTTAGRIDLYKRNCFILEAKQSSKRKRPENLSLPLGDEAQHKAGQARRGTGRWDKVMTEARKQAEQYARDLPVAHGYPPFILVLDIGNVLEVFADFSGQGKNYAHFPDRRSYRLSMDDLLDPDIQDRLRAIWDDPHSLDPARRSAEVTQDVAKRLARIAQRLEKKHEPEEVAEFLMRCLFTMFAEDAELIPGDSFKNLLKRKIEDPATFVPALEDLWAKMDEGGYAGDVGVVLRKFNGTLFKTRAALPLDADDISELHIAAARNWREVEPSIFGTLLERALNPRERAKLGAHYTPRAYVERLVVPTVIEPLRADWDAVKTRVNDLTAEGKGKEALAKVRAFHHDLCTTCVLDPACGTGNFLYVSLELMKRLEGEVLELAEALGDEQERLALSGETVDPSQFFGLEINPRAVPIADLVLWIGYLKWQLRTAGPETIAEPILHAYGTIRQQDAIISYDEKVPVLDEGGKPVTRWDGVTKKIDPVTGNEVPDPAARVQKFDYANPTKAKWPEVEFIVGNPPFIGGKDMRAELGDGYAEACWKARKDVPGGADFVMHFWDAAAEALVRKGTKTRRFGFITTNSITQTFSRRVIEKWMAAKTPLSLIYATPDHPWMKAADKAAVRIAMTVAEAGESEGVLAEVISESDLNTDAPQVELRKTEGKVRAKLAVGADVGALATLWSNSGLAHMGVKLHGDGFILTGSDQVDTNEKERVFSFVNGRDLAQRTRGFTVIDFFGLSQDSVRVSFPKLYQRLLERVKPERDQNARATYRDNWWIWGEPRREWREAKAGLTTVTATVRTAKHRIFLNVGSETVLESKVVGLAVFSPDIRAVLSSRTHVFFSLETGGWLGVGNDSTYNHSDCFNPFPFPILSNDQKPRLAALGERLDAHRKDRLAAHNHLTMTGLYNVLERIRELDSGADVPPLSDAERDVKDAGHVQILKEIHNEIDREVLSAYGWSDLAPALIGKPGATTPSPHKTPEQEAAEEEMLARLVALNQERAAEEAKGIIRWLRPDYQIPKLGKKAPQPPEAELDVVTEQTVSIAAAAIPKWPSDSFEQIKAVRDVLQRADAPLRPAEIASRFKGGKKRAERVSTVLARMEEIGVARQAEDGGRYYVPR